MLWGMFEPGAVSKAINPDVSYVFRYVRIFLLMNLPGEIVYATKEKMEKEKSMESSCKIMIVDDEFIMRQGIRFMMRWEEEGYEIVGEASNGKEALDLIPKLEPHIILCDIAMPIMSGLDFIKIVNREYPDIKTVVLSSYDNFEYVREALLNGAADYVLKPTLNSEELLKLVRKVSQDIPDLQLKKKTVSGLDKMLERYLTGCENELKATDEFRNVLPHSCYRLFVLPLRCRDGSGVDISPVLYEKMEEFLNNIAYCRYLRFLLRRETLCVVLNYGVRDEERLMEDLRDFMNQLGMISERILGTLGFQYKKLEDLKKDFQTPGFLERESFYYRGIHLCSIREITEEDTLEKFDFRKFASAVVSHKYSEAIEIFRIYIEKAVKIQMPEFKLKNQTKNLLYNLVGDSDDRVQELEEISREAFDKIEKSTCCEEFLDVFEEIIEKIVTVLETTEEDQNVYLGKILDYIQKHYTEELNLQNLAAEFNFSYSYLSAYFNQHACEGFSEYVNKIRIQKACEFLKESRYSIAQVSSVVGYSDHSYFCRVFKKITGKTPSAYRRDSR